MTSKSKSPSSLWAVLGVILLVDLAAVAGALLPALARGDQSAVQSEIGTFLWPSVVLLTVGLIYLVGIIPGRHRELVMRRRHDESVVFNIRGRASLTKAFMAAGLLPVGSKPSLLGYSVTAVVGRGGFSLWKRASDEVPILTISAAEIATMSIGELTINSLTYPALHLRVRCDKEVGDIPFMVSSDGPLGAMPARASYIQFIVARSLEKLAATV